jgi:glutamine amidotransferase
MCELFGMSSRLSTNVTFSLSVFGERGGQLGPHKDGWGIGFNEGRFSHCEENGAGVGQRLSSVHRNHDFKS